MNLNFLGEALLGEDEARAPAGEVSRRAADAGGRGALGQDLARSIRRSPRWPASTRCACSATGLELLYRGRGAPPFIRADGTAVPKFVYLDMEEYRDLQSHRGGLHAHARPARAGGRERRASRCRRTFRTPPACSGRSTSGRGGAWRRGGAPVTIRIVKGANMEMERVEAVAAGLAAGSVQGEARHGCELQAHAARSAAARRISPRCGSAWRRTTFSTSPMGWFWRRRRMPATACSLRCSKAWRTISGARWWSGTRNMLLYAPACRKEEFLNAIGYLIRRLDENTGPENFLRHAFKLTPEAAEWRALEHGFREFVSRSDADDAPRRTQNRNTSASTSRALRWTGASFDQRTGHRLVAAAEFGMGGGIVRAECDRRRTSRS